MCWNNIVSAIWGSCCRLFNSLCNFRRLGRVFLDNCRILLRCSSSLAFSGGFFCDAIDGCGCVLDRHTVLCCSGLLSIRWLEVLLLHDGENDDTCRIPPWL